MTEEINEKTMSVHREIAKIIGDFFSERLGDIKAIGFYRGVENDNMLKWLVTHIALGEVLMVKCTKELNIVFPQKHAGMEAFVYGTENFPNQPGGVMTLGRHNPNGDLIRIMDFSINNQPDCLYLDRYPHRVNILFDIAKGKSAGFDEIDTNEIAEFIKRGFIRKNGDELKLNIPTMTNEQYNKLKNMLDDMTTVIAEKTRETINIATDVLVQHAPVSLKKDAENLGGVTSAFSAVIPVNIMVDNGVLQQVAENAHPTTFIMLA